MTHDSASDRPIFREGIPQGFTTLITDDPARSGRFYKALGFLPHARSGHGMDWYERRDRGVVVVAERSVLESFLGFAAGQAGAVMLSLDLDSRIEVDGVFAAGSAAGGLAKRMPDQTPWGAYAGWLADPDGHVWEIGHHPRSPFDQDGRLRAPSDAGI